MKSARVVGDVMGRYHPHGDSAIYDAMVRLAQPFAMPATLIDGKGNWGSPDDSAAASRYTECRLTSAALLLTDGLDEETVDLEDNYDDTRRSRRCCPRRSRTCSSTARAGSRSAWRPT